MSLDQVIHLAINVQDVPPAMPSFGVPMALAAHPIAGPRVRAFASLQEAELLGIVSTDKATRYAHAMLSAAFSQDPRPELVKLGKRSAAADHLVEVTINTVTPGTTWLVKLFDETIGTYTVPTTGSPTPTTVATALVALFTTDVTTKYGVSADNVGESAGPVITVTGAGVAFQLEIAGDELDFSVQDVTGDTTIADDLTAIEGIDPDWYGFGIDSASQEDILAAAAWVETRRKMFVATFADSIAKDAEQDTDTGSALMQVSRRRTHVSYHERVGALLDFGLMSKQFTVDPGTDTWAYKRVAGVAASARQALDTTAQGVLRAKRTNMYVELVAGSPVTLWGRTPDGLYADLVRGVDALYADIQSGQYAVFLANEKIPYEDFGIDLFRAALSDSLERFTSTKARPALLAADPAFTITQRSVADQTSADRGNRIYRGLDWKARASGAVHELYITGSITF